MFLKTHQANYNEMWVKQDDCTYCHRLRMPTASCHTRWCCAIPIIIIVTFSRCFHSSAHKMVFTYNERSVLKMQNWQSRDWQEIFQELPILRTYLTFEEHAIEKSVLLCILNNLFTWNIQVILFFKVFFHARDLVLRISDRNS